MTGDNTATPVWQATADVPRYAALSESVFADVCVVGAGIAGLTTAYLLAREGADVVVLERGAIAGGESSRTTAHLATALDDRYSAIEDDLGATAAKLAAQSHSAAIDRIEAIVTRESIDCEFDRVDGYMFVPPDGPNDILRDELEAAHRAGLSDVALVARAPLPSFDTGPCLRFPRQGQIHPLKYLAGLARAAERLGVRLYTQTHVVNLRGGPAGFVSTNRGSNVTASAVVVATNTPVHDNLTIHFKQGPYRTYVIAAGIPRGSVVKALYWDTPDPYHYVRLGGGAREASTSDYLIVGGEDHRSGEEDDGDERFDALEEWARERFPIGAVEFRWSGQVMEPADGMGLIGRDRLDMPNVYFATGDSGQGMTHGTIAGILITDAIVGRSNAWSALYDPTRVPLQSLDFLQ